MPLVTDHPHFTDYPPPEAVVWRYMDLARFMSLLEEQALFFARADQMQDKWEGAFGPYNEGKRKELYGDDWQLITERFPDLRWNMKQSVFMNCWHQSNVESAAMWDIYQREGRGVAIRSTWSDLTASFAASDIDVYGGKVQYVDYGAHFIPEGNVLLPFLYKRASFEHEKEVRLLIWDSINETYDDNGTPASRTVGFKSQATLAVDLSVLIQGIYLAPDAPSWVEDLVRKIASRYGLHAPVQQSDLKVDPLY